MSAVLEQGAVSIRPMLDDDIEAVVAVERRSYDFPWSPTIFFDCLRVGYCCWVLELGDIIAGYGIMSVAAEESHILNVCVDTSARRSGLASEMLKHLIATAEQHRARIVFLEVRPSNAAAIALYRGFDFRHVGTRRGYYPARRGREDALVMSRSLVLEATDSEVS